MRFLMTLLGCAAASVFVVASAAMNWSFGITLGATELEHQIYGAVSVAADIMKATLPFFIFWSMRNLRLEVTVAAGGLWVLCVIYALTSAFGFAAMTREASATKRGSDVALVAGLKRDLQLKEDRLHNIASVGNPESLDKMLEAARNDLRWKSSNQCTDATTPASRTFCKDYREQEATLGRSKEAASLTGEVEQLRATIAQQEAASGAQTSDPQVGVLSRLVGRDQQWMSTALMVLVVTLVEMGSSFGFFVSMNHGAFLRKKKSEGAPPAPAVAAADVSPTLPRSLEISRGVKKSREVSKDSVRLLEAPRGAETSAEVASLPNGETSNEAATLPIGDVGKIALERTQFNSGCEAPMPDLFRAYVTWCNQNGTRPHNARAFYREFAGLCTALEVTLTHKEGRQVCVGLQLAS